MWKFATGASLLVLMTDAQPVGAVPFDGTSDATAGKSALQILQDGYSTGSGIYWLDPDGVGGDAAFQAYADMTTDGGGWALGLASFYKNPSASTDMVSNTGVAGLNSPHTRDLTHLAVDGATQIRHTMIQNGVVVFDGYYEAAYHDNFPNAADWHMFTGDVNAEFGYGTSVSMAGATWKAAGSSCALTDNPGNPWYYTNCAPSIPVWTGYYFGDPNYLSPLRFNYWQDGQRVLDAYYISVRGDTYGFVEAQVEGVSTPPGLALLLIGLLGMPRRSRGYLI